MKNIRDEVLIETYFKSNLDKDFVVLMKKESIKRELLDKT
ncbi:sporulation histidine kinase inhibitor Sda [Bacillus sp. CGMCC 1.16607]